MTQTKFQGFAAGRQVDNNDPTIHVGGLFSLVDGKISRENITEESSKIGEKYAATLHFLSNKSDCSDVVPSTNFEVTDTKARNEELFHKDGYLCEYTIYNIDHSEINNLANELSSFYDIE